MGRQTLIDAKREREMAENMTGQADRAHVEELLRRPRRMMIRGTLEEGYLAEAPEPPGCITAGETPEQALALFRDAMAL